MEPWSGAELQSTVRSAERLEFSLYLCLSMAECFFNLELLGL
jgi:hypothetical protein